MICFKIMIQSSIIHFLKQYLLLTDGVRKITLFILYESVGPARQGRIGSHIVYVGPNACEVNIHTSTSQTLCSIGRLRKRVIRLSRERCGTHLLRCVRTIRFCSRCYQHAIELDHVRRLPHRNLLSGDLCLCRGRTVLAGAFSSEVDAGSRQENAIAQEVIPILTDQNSWAQARSPMDMMRQGRSMRVFQASQQWSRMSA